MSNLQQQPSSFKDPSGFVFKKDNLFYRQVNKVYADDYDLLMKSGLYKSLTEKKLLLPHSEIDANFSGSQEWYKTILPRQLSFVSYFYEWCFDELKDAAVLTLSVHKTAMKNGMILKDATPYNIQFHRGKPIFIDTLSFEKYDATKPWVAYRQFCECFLFPLLLQKYRNVDAQKMMLAWPEGIPAETVKEFLPMKSNFNLGVGLHVSLQSKIKKGKNAAAYKGDFNETKMLQLIENLQENIKTCTPKKDKTGWSNYYDETISSKEYLQQKEKLFRKIIAPLSFKTVLDIGANDGFFSKIIAERDCEVVAIDDDSVCINRLYNYVRKEKVSNVIPLCVDIANPTPGLGFANIEHASFLDRSRFDVALALGLIHHLAIGKNIPFHQIAQLFSRIAGTLIIEFVPKEDEKVKQLLEYRKDVFPDYDQASFEKAFGDYYNTISNEKIKGTERTMYLLKRKTDA